MPARTRRVLALITAALVAALALPCTAPAVAAPAPAARSAAGTAAPVPLMQGSALFDSGVELHGRLYFSATTPQTGYELWVTDGTAAGTHLVKDVVPGSVGSNPANLVVLGDRLLFVATTNDTGAEWFSTDGTAGGTRLLTDIAPGSQSSRPGPAVVAAGLLWFAANDPTLGRELWRTDGTAPGTLEVADLRPGTPGSDPHSFTSLGDRVVFAAEDEKGATKPFVASPGSGVTRIDNWDAVTDLDPSGFARLDGRVLFAAGNPQAHGEELWVSGGTRADGQEVKDIYPGTTSASPRELTTAGGRVWFRATSPTTGTELWTSDGLPTGTALVQDIHAGATGSMPVNLRSLGDLLLYNADDGQHGTELWATSTRNPSDTHLVLDTLPGPGSGTVTTTDLALVTVAGTSIFTSRDSAGLQPWVTDGTAAGTHRIPDPAAGGPLSSPYAVGVVGDVVVLESGDHPGLYAWSPDWTAPSTPDPGNGATLGHSTTTVHAKAHYSASQGLRKRVTLRVTVADSHGTPLDGGTVTVARNGRTIGAAALVHGLARVRLTVRLRPGKRYAVRATWSGTATVAGSTSPAVTVKVRKGRHSR